MKGALAVLGVIVVGAAAYFIAKGKGHPAPTTSGKTAAGGSVGQQVQKQLASNLITSQNMTALGGLLTSILPSGGAAKVAPVPGSGSGFVTAADLAPSKPLGADPAGEAGGFEFVTDLEG